jgi:Domain of unknown function (DUF4190)/GYF domain 2
MYKIIGADQKEYGPVSAEQLRQWLNEGRVNGHTKVQAANTAEWKTLAEIPEFAALLPKAPPPPLPSARPVPITPLPPKPGNSSLAVWSMVTGICSFLCCCGWFVLAPTSIVLGAVALSRLKNHPEMTGRGFAIAGIVIGVVSILFYGAGSIIAFMDPELMDKVRKLQNNFPQQ